jgi:hypothetical protein
MSWHSRATPRDVTAAAPTVVGYMAPGVQAPLSVEPAALPAGYRDYIRSEARLTREPVWERWIRAYRSRAMAWLLQYGRGR